MFHAQFMSRSMRRKKLPISIMLFVIFYCYSVCLALLYQKIFAPSFLPGIYGGGGFVGNDSLYFDSVASRLADQIQLQGWGVWSVYPAVGAAGNVAVLGALYALFGHDPALIVPVNSTIHAFGGLLIFWITRELSGNKDVGLYAGIIASALFIIFPSSLNWYGQIHKDGFAIVGTLLVLLSWLRAVSRPLDRQEWYKVFLLQISGLIFLGIVRPYGMKLIFLATFLIFVMTLFCKVICRKSSILISVLFFFFFSCVIVSLGVIGTTKLSESIGAKDFAQLGETYSDWTGDGHWEWRDSKWIPKWIERNFETVARTRAGMIDYGVKVRAKSLIDQEAKPESVGEMLIYLPRAFQIALLAPFPDSWLLELSPVRLVAVGEMSVFYLLLPGIIFLIRFNRRPAVFVSIYFACFFLAVYGFTFANLGTLYRIRYGYLFIFLSIGILGWVTWLDKSGRIRRISVWLTSNSDQASNATKISSPNTLRARKDLVGSGVLVMGFTFLGFFGFFMRDVLMANIFGLGNVLDDFFIALMIPMFVVAVLSMPLGMAITPIYLDARERLSSRGVANLVSGISLRMTFVLLAICLVLAFIAPSLLPLLQFRSTVSYGNQLNVLLYLALPILLLSGVVVLGNAVLNAHGRVVLTSAAQLVVPIVTILALALFGREFGVASIIGGMIFGQLINLAIVELCLREFGVSLLPRVGTIGQEEIRSLLSQYLPLAVSALFVGLAAPVATTLAMTLPEGSVSALNLGNKVVLFLTGLLGAAISSVMLPYFSSLVAKNQLISARRELSFFLLASTIVAILVSATLFVWAEPVIRLLFERGGFDNQATASVTRVMQYAIVQLPFFVSNTLLLKFATATKHVLAISFAAIVGLIINVVASLILMKHMGVAGIALASSIAMLLSTLLLVFVLVRYGHITLIDAILIMLNWLMFLTLLTALHFQSAPSIVVTGVTYLVLLLGYFRTLRGDVEPVFELDK